MRKLILLLLCAAAWAQQPVQLTDGTNSPAAVKAAQSQPALADKALTVGLSPNNGGLPVNLLTIVQKHAAVSSGSVASLANAFSSNVAAGNSLVVSFCNGNINAPTAPITDTLTSAWTKAVHVVQGAAFECDVWYAVGISGGADTVTITPGGTNASIASEVYEISGMIAQIPAQADVITSASGSSTTASATAVAPLAPNALMIADVGVGTAAQTITPAANWTNDSGQQNPSTASGLFSFVSMSQQADDVQTITPQATFTSEPWAIAAAFFHSPIVPIGGTVAIYGTPTVTVSNVNANGQATMANSAPVVLASNQSAESAWGQGATGSTVPTGAQYVGGNGSGNLTGIIICDNSAAINLTNSTTLTQVIAISGTSGRTYICSVNVVVSAATNVVLIAGSGTNCASNQTALMGGTTSATGWNFAANGGIAMGSGLGMLIKTATTNNEVCIQSSASTVQVSGSISYTQF